MRWLFVVAVVATMPVLAYASSDDESDDDSEQPAAVELAFTGINARLKAKFAFEVEGPGVALSVHSFAIPPSSVVTSAVAIVEGKRNALRLMKADVANRAFDALTLKPGRDGHRAWAFVLDSSTAAITIDVLAPRSANVVLELTLDAPTCFYNDVRYVELPRSWWQRVPAAQKKISATSDDIGQACGGDGDEAVRWVGKRSGELSKQPAGLRRIGAIAGRLALASTHFARVEIDLSRKLTEIPADLHTVIVVDHSRSLTLDELEAQRAIVSAYLQAAPMSRVQVIGYTRRAQPLLAGWMIASHAAPQVDRSIRALPPRNGSNVEAALDEAAKWLDAVRGTKRILLFSDERLAERFASAELGKLVAAGTLVHVVHPVGFGSGIERNEDEESVLPLLAKATQGIATFGALVEKSHVDATMLVRPISIDKLDVVAPGWERTSSFNNRDCEAALYEGMSCDWWGEGNGAAGPITITGLMWNTPIKRVVNGDPTQARALARMISVSGALDEELQRQVDEIALAVNSVWSLFAQWGGSDGYEDVGGFGRFGSGRISSSSHHTGIRTGTTGRGFGPLDLRAQLQPAIDLCHARDARVAVTVETTIQEIVDVGVDVLPADPARASCITEAIWDMTLAILDPPARATTHVAFGNKR